MKCLVVGGGAAGVFGAIACAEENPSHQVILVEKTRQLLAKVKISGGGRCNVTHACFDPRQLVHHYPRGSRELLGPFTRFQPRDTIEWFEKRGVSLKTEEDGRMFPVSDSSESIIDCLIKEARRVGVEIYLERGLHSIIRTSEGFLVEFMNGQQLECQKILMATGSAYKIYPMLEALGHSIVPLVPSLFTFNIPQSPFLDLSGISVASASVQLPHLHFKEHGALLLTHWGISGPAVLKLSAWAARELHQAEYRTPVVINWLPQYSQEELQHKFQTHKIEHAARQIGSESPLSLPKQLWRRFLSLSGIPDDLRWATLSSKQLQILILQLFGTLLEMEGKTTYKQEFVTAGGVVLDEVNFKTMESRRCPGLYFAGEILNIDGITGGFNFQNAWTTSWIAGHSIKS